MKKLAFILLFAVSLCSIQVSAGQKGSHHPKATQSKSAEGSVTLYFFSSKNCPHCVAAHPFIENLKAGYPWLKVKTYDVTDNPRNSELLEKMAKEHGKESSFLPTFFVGDKMIVGYTNAQTTGSEIRKAVVDSHNDKVNQ